MTDSDDLLRRMRADRDSDWPARLDRVIGAAPTLAEHEIDAWVTTRGRASLSEAELAVLRCISRGLMLSEAAVVLGKGLGTVQTQLKAARTKLRAKNSVQACCEAIRQGLIP